MPKDNVILTVPDMSCSHCENTIKKAVGSLNGVENVIVDLNSKKVSIEYDSTKVSIETMKNAIEDQGYSVK
jgi:copper chaperone